MKEVYPEYLEGWHPLLIDIYNCAKILDLEIEVLQIKEKFGSLRFYYNVDSNDRAKTDILLDIVTLKEIQSETRCISCGSFSRIEYQNGWISNRCEKCRQG